jgi:hypothetical protein
VEPDSKAYHLCMEGYGPAKWIANVTEQEVVESVNRLDPEDVNPSFLPLVVIYPYKDQSSFSHILRKSHEIMIQVNFGNYYKYEDRIVESIMSLTEIACFCHKVKDNDLVKLVLQHLIIYKNRLANQQSPSKHNNRDNTIISILENTIIRVSAYLISTTPSDNIPPAQV